MVVGVPYSRVQWQVTNWWRHVSVGKTCIFYIKTYGVFILFIFNDYNSEIPSLHDLKLIPGGSPYILNSYDLFTFLQNINKLSKKPCFWEGLKWKLSWAATRRELRDEYNVYFSFCTQRPSFPLWSNRNVRET